MPGKSLAPTLLSSLGSAHDPDILCFSFTKHLPFPESGSLNVLFPLPGCFPPDSFPLDNLSQFSALDSSFMSPGSERLPPYALCIVVSASPWPLCAVFPPPPNTDRVLRVPWRAWENNEHSCLCFHVHLAHGIWGMSSR